MCLRGWSGSVDVEKFVGREHGAGEAGPGLPVAVGGGDVCRVEGSAILRHEVCRLGLLGLEALALGGLDRDPLGLDPCGFEAVGLGAALEFMMKLGRDKIAAHEAMLTA